MLCVSDHQPLPCALQVVLVGWATDKHFTLNFDTFSVLMLTGGPALRVTVSRVWGGAVLAGVTFSRVLGGAALPFGPPSAPPSAPPSDFTSPLSASSSPHHPHSQP